MRLSCMSVCLSARPSVCFHDNSRVSGRRMMKLCTIILEVKSNIKFEDGPRILPLTRSNQRFYIMHMHRVHIRLHSVHVRRTHSCGTLIYTCYTSLFCINSLLQWNSNLECRPRRNLYRIYILQGFTYTQCIFF